MQIRVFQDEDQDGVIEVIRGVFEEYDWHWDPASENRDVYDIPTWFRARGGEFWVLDDEGRIHGTVAIRAESAARCSLRRLYLRSALRGKGLGKRLFEHAIAEGIQRGYTSMEIWSDLVHTVSHALYENAGAIPIGNRIIDNPDYVTPYEVKGYLLNLSEYRFTERQIN